ncbi:hypothetical protein CNY67_09740 [Desulfovibrio sp. G11]|nr:hypothetical protein CNY67_09740 [Desulfovibrio sp. G11]
MPPDARAPGGTYIKRANHGRPHVQVCIKNLIRIRRTNAGSETDPPEGPGPQAHGQDAKPEKTAPPHTCRTAHTPSAQPQESHDP